MIFSSVGFFLAFVNKTKLFGFTSVVSGVL